MSERLTVEALDELERLRADALTAIVEADGDADLEGPWTGRIAAYHAALNRAAPALIAAARERDRLVEMQFAPTGDNHHNARLCPYCAKQGEAEAGSLRAQLAAAESERDRLAAALRVSADVIALYADAAIGDNDLPGTAPPLWQVARTMRAALAPPAPERPEAEAKHSPNCSVFTTVGPAFCDCRVKPAAEAICRAIELTAEQRAGLTVPQAAWDAACADALRGKKGGA